MVKRFSREELWTNTTHNGHSITYLHGHDPQELLKITLGDKERVESNMFNARGDPDVYRAKYRRGFVSIRKFNEPDKTIYNIPGELLGIMQDTVLANVGINEIPIAHITNVNGISTIISKWKYGKKAESLTDYLKHSNASFANKEKAVHHAVEFLARLHAAGFSHGHAHPRNFIMTGKSKVTMIDPTLMAKLPGTNNGATNGAVRNLDLNWLFNDVFEASNLGYPSYAEFKRVARSKYKTIYKAECEKRKRS